jgi:hypothetical protein
VIDGGDALICINNAYIDELNHRIVISTRDDTVVQNNNDNSFTVTSYKATPKQQQQHHHRTLQQNHQEIRLLVVRIVDVNGIEPEESIHSVEGAIFGTGPNPDNISESASVVGHLAAITHGKVLLVPSYNDSTTTLPSSGVIDVPITLPVNGSGFFRELQSEILNATELVVGSMDDAADVYIFCLPNGASRGGQTGWTAFTFSWEPVR